ncbi:MAG TPA: hypothetical protein DCO79_15920 [Spirochaeta sp.]|nr:hypothetical protein [Spirochaeta sp.]
MNRVTICIAVLLILALPVFASGEGVSELNGSGVSASELPVTKVTLYTAGLAHMVHETTVNGDEVLLFPVEPKDINDILKSLVVEDLDGGTVDVVNFDSSDPLNVVLGDLRINPAGSPPLFDFVRRTQGEWVTASTEGSELEGRIFSIEKQQSDDGEQIILNLMNSSGISPINITGLNTLKFIDPVLQQELNAALKTIADSRVKSVRTLKISFKGEGERRVRLSYIRAVPLWKTSYRIVLDEDGIPRLEGWAIVQNTGGTAWKDVQLGFVAGMPNAFTMDLATPRYVTRENISTGSSRPIGTTAYEKSYAPAPSAARSSAAYDAPSMAMADEVYAYAEEEPYSPPAVAAQASAVSSGNFYRYDVKHPVTVDARSSAMIPIIQHEGAGTSLGVYDPSYNLVFKGIRLKNSTGAQWAAGPATVLEGRYYGGDVLLPEMLPDSERLLTYAVHGSLEVEKSSETTDRVMTALKISEGLLYRTDRMERQTSYRISGDEDELLILHPRNSGWKLIDSPEIAEETPSQYRFRLTEWEKPAIVKEEYIISNQYSLIGFHINDFVYYMEWNQINPEMKRAFERISELKRRVESISADINGLNSRINRIVRDQSRIRENMKVLDKESDLFEQYSGQLESQEKDITVLYEKQSKKQTELQNAGKSLSDYIAGLDID